MNVKQLQPSYASHIEYVKAKNIKSLFEGGLMVGQAKYDGARLLVHFDGDNTYCTSRRISKKTGKYHELQNRLVTFKSKVDLGYTVLDGEVYSKDWSTTAGITKALPEKSFELQKENQIRFAAFDCLFFDGVDIRSRPYVERYLAAKIVIDIIKKEFMHITESIKVNSREHAIVLLDEYINKGFEGLVVKHLQKTYDEKYAMLKLKKSETLDCVVYDIVQGKGKYIDTVGALRLGYYDEETSKIVHITNCAPGTDNDRNNWRDNWERMRLAVIEIECQEITKTSVKHPRIVRIRHDKDYTMCTRETIFKEEE